MHINYFNILCYFVTEFIMKQKFLQLIYFCFFVYTEQAIDITILKSLTPDIIKELIPTIGLRIRFTMKWEEHLGISKDVILFSII